ncbi:DNA ligase 3-like [Pogonomyrmex barbatus]|uniref:DNA ligase 3-like n=1 Tax=Pogonomyrmex barbatus TaxID=144034 RepID=A0A6I9W9E3_9HYME|nr:DNA ligase 3-like [Pogonomyrmex barbatus]XP_011635364.1 DNA ligase 3-like [Pogonomyrmex barbatus]
MASDAEEDRQQEEEKPFAVERAKTGRAKCKKCKCPIEKDQIRIGKFVTNFFSEGKLMPAWHHVTCLFDVFAKQRATTKKIDDPAEDVKGWDQLSDDDRKVILDKLVEFEKTCNYPKLILRKRLIFSKSR